MPRNITVTFDDGSTHVYQQAPDNLTPEQVSARAQKDFGKAVASLDGGKPAAVSVGSALNEIPRQLGLTARYALEGPAQAAELVTEPVRKLITDPLARMFVRPGVSDIVKGTVRKEGKPLGQMASDFADMIGLPKPQDANERVIGDMTRAVAGAGGLSSVGRAVSATPGMVGQIGSFLGSSPSQNLVSAAGASGAAGASREAGGDPMMQLAASVVGGLAAPGAAGLAASGAKKVGAFVQNRVAPQVVDRNIENTIALTLNRVGVDWRSLDTATRNAVKADARAALQTGGTLDAEAMRRLVDFRRVGATPTVGSLTLDPVQITREKNLAKMGANSSDSSLHQLAQTESQNNARLIGNLNDSGAARALDPHATGENLIGALNNYGSGQQRNIGSLYSAARDTAGRSAELDGHAFTQRANQLLQENLAGKLPAQIESALNAIAQGKAPLTVDHAEQLKTALARISRSSADGNERYAMGLIRQALEEAPLRGAQRVNPGNLPAVPGTVPPSAANLGQEAIDAFTQARTANRQFMGQREAVPALDAAMNGAQPDNFLRQFVLGTGNDAAVNNVRGMRDLLQTQRINPDNLPATAEQIRNLPPAQSGQALNDVKHAIAAHLKSKALGGAADEVGNFSQSAYNKALRDIGERKLSLFFSPDEIAQLQAVGRVSSYLQYQPRGSAVNNSNSGAMLAGNALDFLSTKASVLPLGLKDTVSGTISGLQARRAMTASRGLLTPQQSAPLLEQMAPGLLYGGLLAAPQIAPNR
jgi:hypothetical protein